MDISSKEHFITSEHWNAARPEVLVVACSDGRLQFSIDHFLSAELAIRDYDRMYMPGGFGALVPGGSEFIRAENYRRDLFFLIEAHGVKKLILLAHGADDSGPPECGCALYRRLMPGKSPKEIRDQQVKDVQEFLKSTESHLTKVHVRAYLAEVLDDLTVRYIEIM